MSGLDDYEVGYGRPPKRSQFAPGQSGNPGGRPAKGKEDQLDPSRVIDQPVEIREGGERRKMQPKEVTLRQLVRKALNGDLRSNLRLVEEFVRYDVLMPAPPSASRGGVVALPTDRMPFEMASIMAQRFGCRKAYTRKQRSIARAEYLSTRSDRQAMIDAEIGYHDLKEDLS